MHFRILKMIATSGFLTALECIKFDFSRGSAPDPLGELTALPRPPSWFKGPTSKGRGKKGEKGKRGEGGERRGEKGGKDVGRDRDGEWKGRPIDEEGEEGGQGMEEK